MAKSPKIYMEKHIKTNEKAGKNNRFYIGE